jgi:hypothetical protein
MSEYKVFPALIGDLVVAATTPHQGHVWLTELQQYRSAQPSSYRFYSADSLAQASSKYESPHAKAEALALKAWTTSGFTRSTVLPINYSVGIVTDVVLAKPDTLAFETVSVFYDGRSFSFNNVPQQQVLLSAEQTQLYESDSSAFCLLLPPDDVIVEHAARMVNMCLLYSGQLNPTH